MNDYFFHMSPFDVGHSSAIILLAKVMVVCIVLSVIFRDRYLAAQESNSVVRAWLYRAIGSWFYIGIPCLAYFVCPYLIAYILLRDVGISNELSLIVAAAVPLFSTHYYIKMMAAMRLCSFDETVCEISERHPKLSTRYRRWVLVLYPKSVIANEAFRKSRNEAYICLANIKQSLEQREQIVRNMKQWDKDHPTAKNAPDNYTCLWYDNICQILGIKNSSQLNPSKMTKQQLNYVMPIITNVN